MPHGRRWSRATLLRQVCGNLKSASVIARLYAAAGAPVTVVGLYFSVSGLNGRAVVLRISSNPVCTPVLPIWFEIHTNGGLPVKTPVPPRTWVLRSWRTSQLKPTRGDQSGVAFGSVAVP